MSKSAWKLVLGLIGFIALSYLASIPGQVNRPGDWFHSLVKPPLMPPGWAFGVAWSMLYLLIAVAAWRVWKTTDSQPGQPERWLRALGFWGGQLLLNAAWSPVFFQAHRIGIALIVLLLLLGVLSLTVLVFRKIDRSAAILLMPYLGWICFATYLNAGFLVLNP